MNQVMDLSNIKVVENPTVAEDNLRIQRAFEPYYECEQCGCGGTLVDWYYEFPFLWRRLSTRNLQREVMKKTTEYSEPLSEPDWAYNQTFETLPEGPYANEGEAEWQRFVGTQAGEDLRTNKEVEEAEWMRERWEEEVEAANAATPEENQAWIDLVMNRSKEVQKLMVSQSDRKPGKKVKKGNAALLEGFENEDAGHGAGGQAKGGEGDDDDDDKGVDGDDGDDDDGDDDNDFDITMGGNDETTPDDDSGESYQSDSELVEQQLQRMRAQEKDKFEAFEERRKAQLIEGRGGAAVFGAGECRSGRGEGGEGEGGGEEEGTGEVEVKGGKGGGRGVRGRRGGRGRAVNRGGGEAIKRGGGESAKRGQGRGG